MAKTNKELNKYELKLQKDIEDLMRNEKVKFSVFLKVLRPDIPDDKSSNEYKNIHKAEYLKQLRASYSVLEIKNMLAVLGYKLRFTTDNKDLIPVCYDIDDNIKVKYTELLAVCEILGINIEWEKTSIEGPKHH